jgi:hypothetical protein
VTRARRNEQKLQTPRSDGVAFRKRIDIGV